MRTILASGYFDPLHVGHVEYLEKAKALGDKLIVIVNNDKQAILKKGKEFMPFKERIKILESLKSIDSVIPSIDEDKTVCKTIEFIAEKEKIDIFAKGGDRSASEIPEKAICDFLGIKIIDSLGEKIQSSSFLIKKAEKK